VRAPKEVLHKLQFFVELLHDGVCGAVPNTPLASNSMEIGNHKHLMQQCLVSSKFTA